MAREVQSSTGYGELLVQHGAAATGKHGVSGVSRVSSTGRGTAGDTSSSTTTAILLLSTADASRARRDIWLSHGSGVGPARGRTVSASNLRVSHHRRRSLLQREKRRAAVFARCQEVLPAAADFKIVRELCSLRAGGLTHAVQTLACGGNFTQFCPGSSLEFFSGSHGVLGIFASRRSTNRCVGPGVELILSSFFRRRLPIVCDRGRLESSDLWFRLLAGWPPSVKRSRCLKSLRILSVALLILSLTDSLFYWRCVP